VGKGWGRAILYSLGFFRNDFGRNRFNSMVLQHGVVSAAQSPIATDICPEPADGISVTPDTCLILMNQATAGVMLPIKGKASLVLLKLPLRMLQLLLVSAQVA
jgi:hypothetical protein